MTPLLSHLAILERFFAASVFMFCASYTWHIAIEVRGLRGTSMAILFTCCAVICAAAGLILAEQTIIPVAILWAINSGAWPPMIVCALVLTDLYAADRNNHRSFTTRSYEWYKRVTKSPGEDGDRHTPITLSHSGD